MIKRYKLFCSLVVCLFLMVACHRQASNELSLPQWAERMNKIPLPEKIQGDSLIDVYFKYNQIVNGYDVTARWRTFDKKSETGKVIMNFHHRKTGKDYQYFREKFSSYDTDHVTFANDFKGHQKGDVYYFNYTSPDTLDHFKEYNDNSPLGYYTPFQFLDIDFDGNDELLVSDWYQGRAGNNYEVFKLTENGLQKLDYMPLERLVNADKIDLEKKTITIVMEDGVSDNAKFYFSRNERKDRIDDVPTFFSFCASDFDFKKYNSEMGVPFVLDSIREYARTDVEHRATYEVKGNRIVRKE